MEARTFDPLNLNKPKVALGDHGTWDLGDLTSSREERVNATFAAINDISEREAAAAKPKATAKAKAAAPSTDEYVRAVGDLVEAACEEAAGLSDRIVQLYTDQQIGAKGLRGLVQHVSDWLLDGLTAGEGSGPS